MSTNRKIGVAAIAAVKLQAERSHVRDAGSQMLKLGRLAIGSIAMFALCLTPSAQLRSQERPVHTSGIPSVPAKSEATLPLPMDAALVDGNVRKTRGTQEAGTAALTRDGQNWAQPQPAPKSTGSALPVGGAEVVLVKVLGYPSITGEYRVNADDTISIPVIGRLPVAHMTVPDLERDLAARVLRETGKEAYATIEIVRYKPVFVSGQVATAGAYAWSPGMTVLHAETLSGGIYRQLRLATASGLAGDATGKERAIADLKLALANHARLTAESKGLSAIEIPEKLEWLVGKAEARQAIAAQQRVLESRMLARQAQMAILTEGLGSAQTELDGIREQASQLKLQIKIRDQYYQKLLRLKADRVISEERMMEQQALIAGLQEREALLSATRARAEGTILNHKQERIRLEEVRNAEMAAEFINLDRDIQRATIDLETARSAERLAARENSGAATTGTAEDHRSYLIIRGVGSAARQIQADKFTSVQPGDIIVVNVN